MAIHTDRTITIQLSGTRDRDSLRLDDFLEELQTIRAALRETERLVSGKEPTLHLQITALKKSSPAVVTLEAVSEAHDERALPEYANYVVRSFTANLRLITNRKKLPGKIDMVTLESYREMAAPVEKNRIEVQIKTGNNAVLINRNFKTILEEVMGEDEFAHGSISGKIEAINIHNRNRFWLYPIIGPRRVVGKFKAKDRKRFTAAVDKYVTVYGRLRYKTWDKYPYAIKADDIEIHDESVSLLDLRGIAPDATGNLTTQEYIDQLRDDL
jgi:hypothetical protein